MGETERTVWDDAKNDGNVLHRGIDFASIDAAFDGRFSLVREDRRRDYGEPRFNMLVEISGLVLNVTYTPRGGRWRIISARLANRQERGIYHAGRQDS